ncbi:hypothetical protein M413DRAFT_99881 [Hebeloma cylindrosporum]|uniref:t-SNARE coiled-coil homology domain-containing protein n=1 Tax=Hebeloma cylindrosporum TaxID=76867 RepID=A0A0C2YHH2_HEBCY|nr:hypothetical protein M413DRAFT_99881 [Hebeloma cylindrosporum h7]
MVYRDRLAASRAQRTQNIELSNVNPEATPASASVAGTVSDLPAFLAEDTAIQEGIQQLRDNVSQISSSRIRSLNAIGDVSQAESTRIDALTAETRTLMHDLKERIRALENAPITQDAKLRNNRIKVLRKKFLEAIEDYQREEQESRLRSRQRVERQLKIVKPDATPEEVAVAVDGGGQQVFAQALTTSTRYGESRAAYREVQERHHDLQKVEKTLTELAQLFSDLGTWVEQQDAVITDVETTAGHVKGDTEAALQHTETAVKHARAYRKKRWICFFILLVILCILAIVLGVVFGKK